MRRQADFRIAELDCAEEVLALRRMLEGQPGVLELGFDPLRGRMLVAYDDQRTSPVEIERRVARGGMHAEPWGEAGANQTAGKDATGVASPSVVPGWPADARAALTTAAGFLLALAFVVHWLTLGNLRAVLAEPFDAAEVVAIPWPVRALYLASIAAGAWFVLPKAMEAVRRLRADMNLLMCVAVLGALWLGQWFEAASVTFLFSLALLLEQWSLGRARRAIAALIDVTPPTARVIPASGDISGATPIPVEQAAVGSRVVVRPGEKIPLDGRVLAGTSDVNEAPITGEPLPRTKQPGAEVFAGTVNGEGTLEFEVTRPAADTTLARIVHMVAEAQTRRAPSQQWVETFAQYYTPAMMAAAALVALVPPLLLGRPWTPWFYQALVVLVIACPCALVISTPVSIVSALTAAMRRGVLVKGGRFLEEAARLRAVALDKTGTLTHGRPLVERIVCFEGHTASEVLGRAAAMEAHSDHPIARAILRRAHVDGVPVIHADDYRVLPGKGAQGTFDRRPFWIGSHRFLHEKMADEPLDVHDQALRLEDAGHTVIAVGNAEHVCGLISLADEPRAEAREIVSDLRRVGVSRIVMLTGDHATTAAEVAHLAGINDFHADLLPQDKARHVESLRAAHGHVAMIGDGVNDAPAMAAASLGIAMAAMGSDTAIETADVALLSDDLSKVPWLIRHGRRTLHIVRQNIGFALGTKAVFLTLAALGAGSLWMAIAADMGASLLVVFNGLRLLRPKAAT